MTNAMQQMIDPDGWVRSRQAIIRNTSPELKTTTINTWKEFFKEEHCGPIVFSSPINHHIVIPPSGGKPGFDCEVLFIALDKPADVRKLKSLDLTTAWVNESSELQRAVPDMLTGRVGRFPPRKGDYQAVNACIIMDTNAFDDDHYLAELEDEGDQQYGFYTQPPAVLELEAVGKGFRCIDEGKFYDLKFRQNTDVIEGAGKLWAVNPFAENLPFLRDGYYRSQIAGKKLEWIRRFLQAKRIYYTDGKPVIPEYQDEVFCQKIPVLKGVPFTVGMDIGGGTLQPAAVIKQRHPRGNWLVHAEVCSTSMGVEKFVKEFCRIFVKDFGTLDKIETIWGDPASEKRDELYETVVADYIKALGLPFRAAPSNNIQFRIDATTAPMNRFIDGKPGFLIHPRCKMLRKGLAGRWYYKRMQLSGENRYQDKPCKNDFSHPCDALGYGLSGGGETLQARNASGQPVTQNFGQAHADINFDIFSQ